EDHGADEEEGDRGADRQREEDDDLKARDARDSRLSPAEDPSEEGAPRRRPHDASAGGIERRGDGLPRRHLHSLRRRRAAADRASPTAPTAKSPPAALVSAPTAPTAHCTPPARCFCGSLAWSPPSGDVGPESTGGAAASGSSHIRQAYVTGD